jgi:hypothetical protein
MLMLMVDVDGEGITPIDKSGSIVGRITLGSYGYCTGSPTVAFIFAEVALF